MPESVIKIPSREWAILNALGSNVSLNPANPEPEIHANIPATEPRGNSVIEKRCRSSKNGDCACCATESDHLPLYWEAYDEASIKKLVDDEYTTSDTVGLEMKERHIDFIVIHYAATGNNFGGAVDIHKSNINENSGWWRAGYHWVINRKGGVEPLVRMSHHANGISTEGVNYVGKIKFLKSKASFNHRSIQICYMGGPQETPSPGEGKMLQTQKESLMLLLKSLLDRYPNIKYIVGHNDLEKEDSPGFDVGRDLLSVSLDDYNISSEYIAELNNMFENRKLPGGYISKLKENLYKNDDASWNETHKNICW